MNQYVTGTIIKRLREKAGMTQLELAEKLQVSDKAVSKWETGKGYPDITLIEQLSAYIQSTGKKYADHAATLRIWAKRQQSEKKTAPGIPDYTFAKGESL